MAAKKKAPDVPTDAPAEAVAEHTVGTRSVQVEVVKRGFIGSIREPGEVFTLELAEGQPLPSWVKATTDDVPPTLED